MSGPFIWPFCLGLGDDSFFNFGLTAATGPNLLLPNPRRTLAPEQDGWAGEPFDNITTVEDDTFTFDLSWRLAGPIGTYPAETIAQIAGFTVTAQDPNGGSDLTPASRAIGAPGTFGSTVSQMFGNWLPGSLRYRVQATVLTSRGNTISNWSFVQVTLPGN